MSVHFDPNTTSGPSNPGGKPSVTIYGIETRTILGFEKAISPGDYYIENFALLPNASNHGGGSFKYATSELNDALRTFVKEGIGGVKDMLEDKYIPEDIKRHFQQAEKFQRLAKNPKNLVSNYASRSKNFVQKELGLGKFFRTGKKVFSIGVDISEAIFTPEVFVTKSIRNLTKRTTRKASRNLRNKAFKAL
ncbi:hypothetical protein [Mycobacterium sp.]|uniref:hypothetical protein n=1 Tax=Mycobacterium sp. TaxID=1785 RepID=UPI003A8530DA